MTSRLKYLKVTETTATDATVLLQIRTGTAAGTQLVATVHTTLSATLRQVREKLVEIAVKGTATSTHGYKGDVAESGALVGLADDDVKAIVAHKLHAFDMSAHFQFVKKGGCTAYSAEEEQHTAVHAALPLVPSFGLPSTGPMWSLEPRPGSVAVRRPYSTNTKLTINVEKDDSDEGNKVTKLSNALLILYVRQGEAGVGAPRPSPEAHCERILLERFLMSDVPFGKMITPKHLSLLVSRWNINTRDFLGRTILHECCADGNLPAVRYLLSLAADMPLVADEVDYSGRTCLHYAVQGGHYEVVGELLANNTNPNLRASPRRYHFSKGATKAIGTAEEELAAVGRALPFNPLRPDFVGRTPLHMALGLRHDTLTEQMCHAVSALPLQVLQYMHLCVYGLYYGHDAQPAGRGLVGAKLEDVTSKAQQKLYEAFKTGAPTKAIRMPWDGEERYASVTALFAELSPSLLQLASDGNVAAMMALLQHPLFDKRKALQRGPSNESLLHLAARKGHTEMVRFLVSDDFAVDLFPQNNFVPRLDDAKADAMVDACGRTPLHYACMNGYADTLLELLRYATAFGDTEGAAENEGVGAPSHGANNDSSSDDDDDRALITGDGMACTPDKLGDHKGRMVVVGNAAAPSSRRPQAATRLANLNVNAIDACGCSALQWALRNGHVDCARVLLEVYREAVGTDASLIVSVADHHGMTPLHIAAASGADDVVHTLIHDYRVHPSTRVLTTTSYRSRAAPSAKEVERRKEASASCSLQLLEAAAAPNVRSGKQVKTIVKTLGPSPLWLALHEGRQATAALLANMGALGDVPISGVLPAIIDVDLTAINDEVGVPLRQLQQRRAGMASSNNGRLFMSPNRAARMPPPPSTRHEPSQTDAHVKEAGFWHMRAMLKVSLEGSLLPMSQTILTALHHLGYAERLAMDAPLLIAFAANGNDYALRWLIDRGVGRDSHRQHNGITILSACCYARNINAVRFLLEGVGGVDVNCGVGAADQSDADDSAFTTTPLYLAIAASRYEAASTELVDLLIRKGAHVSYGNASPAASASSPAADGGLAHSSHTPKSSLYRPLVQAALRGDYGIVQILCGYDGTTPKDAAIALWWLLNAVPAVNDVLFVRQSVSRILEAAEGSHNKGLRVAFGEGGRHQQHSPSASSSPSVTGVRQYDAIAVALFRKVRLVAESPIHPMELLHVAASKLWHFGAFVHTLVGSLKELPIDIRRVIVETATPVAGAAGGTAAAKDGDASFDSNGGATTPPPPRAGMASPSTFIAAMADGSYTPYHRAVGRDVFGSILRNAPSAISSKQGVLCSDGTAATSTYTITEWYVLVRALVEECGLYPSRTYDHHQNSCADYALLSGHRPSLLYFMALGLLPLRQFTAPVTEDAPRASSHTSLRALAAIAAEVVSDLRKLRGIDYITGAMVAKISEKELKRPPVPDRRGHTKERHRPKRDAPRPIPAEELQEAAAMVTLLTFIHKGDVTSIRTCLTALAAVCRLGSFAPLVRPNVGASGPIHRIPTAMAVRITNLWAPTLVLVALEAHNTAIVEMLLDEFRFDVSAPSTGARVGGGDSTGEAQQLLANAIAFGCDLATIRLLLAHKAPMAAPSTLTRHAQAALRKRIPMMEPSGGKYTSLFVAAAFGRMDVVRLFHAAVCEEERASTGRLAGTGVAIGYGADDAADGTATTTDRFAQIFTLAEARTDLSEGVHYDALAAIVLATKSSVSHATSTAAAEMAHFLVTKAAWPYANPYLLRIAASRRQWPMVRLLLQCYGPSIVVADLRVRAAEVAEEERIRREERGLPPIDAEEEEGKTPNDGEAVLSAANVADYSSPRRLKGLGKCSALSCLMRYSTGTAVSREGGADADATMAAEEEGIAVLRLAMDMLAMAERGFVADAQSPNGAADEADREIDTIDERLERLKRELQDSIRPFGAAGTSISGRPRYSSGQAPIPTHIASQRHNVRLATPLVTMACPWESLLLNHRPSLLKGAMLSGKHRQLAGYLALLAFCTQPLSKVAPPVQTLSIPVASGVGCCVASSATTTTTATQMARQKRHQQLQQHDKTTPRVIQQLMSLLFELTHSPTAAALVPSDGYQRLVYVLKAVIRKNQPALLTLLLANSTAVIVKASLTDLAAMKELTFESLHYLTLQHADGQCAAVVGKAAADNPRDAMLRVLCYGSQRWSAETIMAPYTAAVYQHVVLSSLGRVERAPREHLVATVLSTLLATSGPALGLGLLDVSAIHVGSIAATTTPALIIALRPYLTHLPGGIVLVAASPLLIAVALGQEGVVSQLLGSRVVTGACSSSRAYVTMSDFKGTVVYNKELMMSPDERKRLIFLRDGELSNTVALPAVNVAVALCLKAASRVLAATGADASPTKAIIIGASTAHAGTMTSSNSSTEAAFAYFKRTAIIVKTLFKYGALNADSVGAIGVAMGHIMSTLTGLRVPSTMRIAIGAAKAELLESFLGSAAAAVNSKGGPFLTPVRFTDRKRHIALFTTCDLTNNKHILHSLLNLQRTRYHRSAANQQQQRQQSPIATATAAVDADILRAVLQCTDPSDVENARDDNGRSAIYYLLASPNAPAGVVDALLKMRPSARSTVCHQRKGWTPLMVACIYGRADSSILGPLLSMTELQQRDANGCTATWHACANGHPTIVKALIDYIRSNGGSLSDYLLAEDTHRHLNGLLACAADGKDDACMKLLEYIPAKMVFKMARSQQWGRDELANEEGSPSANPAPTTLFHCAAKGGCARLMQYLLDLQIKAPAEFGKLVGNIIATPRTAATLQTLSALNPLRQIAPYTVADGNGLSALSIAYYSGKVVVLGKLIVALRRFLVGGVGGGGSDGSKDATAQLHPNAVATSSIALRKALGDDSADVIASAVDRALVLGDVFNAFNLKGLSTTSSEDAAGDMSVRSADGLIGDDTPNTNNNGLNDDPDDPFVRARLRDEARQCCDDADTRKKKQLQAALGVYRRALPIGWFGAAMRLDAVLAAEERAGVIADVTTMTTTRPLTSEPSLLRWCVKNHFIAGIRVCHDLGLMDVSTTGSGDAKPLPSTTALHLAAKRLDLDAAQLLVSLGMSSVFALDKYGNTPLDLCLKAGAKGAAAAVGGSEQHHAGPSSVPATLDTTTTAMGGTPSSSSSTMAIAERCARFLITRMFAKPNVLATLKLPDGSLYIHTLFQRVAATRMPNLIGVLEARFMQLASSGTATPSQAALFVLQLVQRQESESLRAKTSLKKAMGGGEGMGGSLGAMGGSAGGFASRWGNDDDAEVSQDGDTAGESVFHTDTYSAFEVALLHGCAAMVLRIAESIRTLAVLAAKGADGANATNNSFLSSRFGGNNTSMLGGSLSSSANPSMDAAGAHPLGTISLSASFLRDHLVSMSPSIRAVLYDLFRVSSVTKECGMQVMGLGDEHRNGSDADDDDDGNSSNGGDSSDRSSNKKANAKPDGTKDIANKTIDPSRLTFADVRMIGIADMMRHPMLHNHIEAIYTIPHERSVVAKELIPLMLGNELTAASGGVGKAADGTSGAALVATATSRTPTTTRPPIRIDIDDSITTLPPFVQRQALQCLTTTAVAGRYSGLDIPTRFPFVATIAIKFVANPDEAIGLHVGAEGPSRLVDAVCIIDGYIVSDEGGSGSGMEGAMVPADAFTFASPLLAGSTASSPFAASVTSPLHMGGAFGASLTGLPLPTGPSAGGSTAIISSDVNTSVEGVLGTRLPMLKKRIDAECKQLTDFFHTTTKTMPLWSAFTPLQQLSVRVDWSASAAGPSTISGRAAAGYDVQSAITKLLGTFSQRSNAMVTHRGLAMEMEHAMQLLLSPDVFGGRLAVSSLREVKGGIVASADDEDDAAANDDAVPKRVRKAKRIGASSASILELIQSALLGAGYGDGPSGPAGVVGNVQPVTRSICFAFMPTTGLVAPTSSLQAAGGRSGCARSIPLRPRDVIAKHREGSELVIPFSASGIGMPYVCGDGTIALEPILCDPLQTYLAPIVGHIERSGALFNAQKLKEKCLLQPLMEAVMRNVNNNSTGAENSDDVAKRLKMPAAVSDFCNFVRFKLELEDDASSLGGVRMSQIQTALSNLAAVLADIARALPPTVPLVGAETSTTSDGHTTTTTRRAASPSSPTYAPMYATTDLDTNPRAIVPNAIASNIFNTVRAITVVYTSHSSRVGMLRRVPAGSSGAGKSDSIGDGAKVVLVVTEDDGHQYSKIRERLWYDTLRVEMARVSHVVQSTVSDLRHQLSTYYPTADFGMPMLPMLIHGPPTLPQSSDVYGTGAAISAAVGGPSTATLMADYVAKAEKALYQSELLKLGSSSLTATSAVDATTTSSALVLQGLLKGLAVGWDTTLGARLREVIRVIELTEPIMCPMPNTSYGPADKAPNVVRYTAGSKREAISGGTAVGGTITYECPALYYPPPKAARTVGSLLLGSEAIAGQLLVAISNVVDIARSVELGRAFAPFCAPTAARDDYDGAEGYAKPLEHRGHDTDAGEGGGDAATKPSHRLATTNPSTLWSTTAGQRYTIRIAQRNILGQALSHNGELYQYNTHRKRLAKEAMLTALDDAVAGGRMGHVNVSKHLAQIEAKVKGMRSEAKAQLAQPSALRIDFGGESTPPEHYQSFQLGAEGENALENASHNSTTAATKRLFNNITVETNTAAGALDVSFDAPTLAGDYTLRMSLYGTPINCGAPVVLSVAPQPAIGAIAQRPLFPNTVDFFTGKQVGGGKLRKALGTSTSSATDSGTSNAPIITTVVRGTPFEAFIPLSDACGNAISMATAIGIADGIVINEPLTEEYTYTAAGDDDDKPAVPPTTRMSITLEGAIEDQLSIVSATMGPQQLGGSSNNNNNKKVGLRLTLISGPLVGGTKKGPRSSALTSPNTNANNDDEAQRFAFDYLNNSTANEDDDPDASIRVDEAEGFQLDNVRLVVQVGTAATITTTSTCELFDKLTVMSRAEWDSAEAARRGVYGDLSFIRDNKTRVRKAVVQYTLKLLEAGDDMIKAKHISRPSVLQQYEKMQKRLAERCALYYRKSTRRAQLARRQAEAQSVGMKGMVVPRGMLRRSLNSALSIDIEAMRRHAHTLFADMERQKRRQQLQGRRHDHDDE